MCGWFCIPTGRDNCYNVQLSTCSRLSNLFAKPVHMYVLLSLTTVLVLYIGCTTYTLHAGSPGLCTIGIVYLIDSGVCTSQWWCVYQSVVVCVPVSGGVLWHRGSYGCGVL